MITRLRSLWIVVLHRPPLLFVRHPAAPLPTQQSNQTLSISVYQASIGIRSFKA